MYLTPIPAGEMAARHQRFIEVAASIGVDSE